MREARFHRMLNSNSFAACISKEIHKAGAVFFSFVMFASFVTNIVLAGDFDRLPSAVVRVLCWSEDKIVGGGSGFIVSPSGYILTNYHVIEKATAVSVVGKEVGGTPVPAIEIDRDHLADIAVLKINLPNDLPCVRLGTAEGLAPKTRVYAVGFPVAADIGESGLLEPTFSEGIVSAVKSQEGVGPVVQTDAAISPGNSGGPLVLGNGDVVGINTFIAVGPEVQGIGFAVSIDTAKALLALNRVKFEAPRGLADRLFSPRAALSVLALFVLMYGVWMGYALVSYGWEGFRERLPSKVAVQCMIASLLLHLTGMLALVLWQWLSAERELYMEAGAESVKVLHVAPAQSEAIAIPQPAAPEDAAPRASEPETKVVEVEKVDTQKVKESAEKVIKDIDGKAAATSEKIQGEMLEHARSAAEDARTQVEKGREAAKGLQQRIQDVLNGLGKADAETEQRRARWTVEVEVSCDAQVMDQYNGEFATPKPGDEETLIYISKVTLGKPQVREGPMRAEKRMRWVCDKAFESNNREFYRRAGYDLGQDPVVVAFFPKEFEDMLAQLEKDYVTGQKRRKFDADEILRTVFRHDLQRPFRVWVRDVLFAR